MSNNSKQYDHSPFISQSGKISTVDGDNVDKCLRQNLYFTPSTSTPEKIKKFRKSVRDEPGKKQLHPGVFNDPKDYENLVHGAKSMPSDHVEQCVKNTNSSGIKQFLNSYNEKNYVRSIKEPLGKGLQRNYIMPDETKSDSFRYGIPSYGLQNAKEILYSNVSISETPETKRLYNKTHGLTDPGEQKTRDYNWMFDKNIHVFGKADNKEIDGAKKSLKSDSLNCEFPKTVLVSKRSEDFRQANNDMLGRGKFKGTINENAAFNESFCYGIKSNTKENMWNVGKLIHGDQKLISQKELEPDRDLGKSTLNRSKLSTAIPHTPDPGRSFGVPSVRTDIPRRGNNTKITERTNHGDDNDVFELLYPNPHSTKGLDNPDFEEMISKNELRQILSKNGHNLKDCDLDIIFEVTLTNQPNPDNKVSYKIFLDTIKNFKREYIKYKNLLG